jgi:hypothetical protein
MHCYISKATVSASGFESSELSRTLVLDYLAIQVAQYTHPRRRVAIILNQGTCRGDPYGPSRETPHMLSLWVTLGESPVAFFSPESSTAATLDRLRWATLWASAVSS